MTVKTTHAIISGKVQGVSYRAWTVEEAASLGLNGWVRNRRDGTVEAVFSGEEASVNNMLEKCKDGPPAADVSEVKATPSGEMPEPGFHKRPTV